MVFYTNLFKQEPHAAFTFLFLIFITLDYKDDAGLLAHEKVHVKQFWRTFGLFPLFYILNDQYKYECEVEAYKTQLEFYPTEENYQLFATFIETRYSLTVPRAQILTDLYAP